MGGDWGCEYCGQTLPEQPVCRQVKARRTAEGSARRCMWYGKLWHLADLSEQLALFRLSPAGTGRVGTQQVGTEGSLGPVASVEAGSFFLKVSFFYF